MSGVPGTASAALSPGSTRSSRTSVGRAPERVTSSTCTPVLGPVHSGAVPPRTRAPAAPASCSASSGSTSVHEPQPPSASWTRTCTSVSVTASSCAQVTPARENSSTSVLSTVSVGAVAGTPATGSLVPGCTSAAGAGSATEPIATSSVEVVTGSGSGTGAAYTGSTRTVPVNTTKASGPTSRRRTGGALREEEPGGDRTRGCGRPHRVASSTPGHPAGRRTRSRTGKRG